MQCSGLGMLLPFWCISEQAAPYKSIVSILAARQADPCVEPEQSPDDEDDMQQLLLPPACGPGADSAAGYEQHSQVGGSRPCKLQGMVAACGSRVGGSESQRCAVMPAH